MISKDELSSILMYYGIRNKVRMNISKILDNAIAWWKEKDNNLVYIHIVTLQGLHIVLQPNDLGIMIEKIGTHPNAVIAKGDK